MYTDAHCHLAHPAWQSELEGAMKRAQASGVTAWIAGGIEPKEWESQKELSQRWPLKLVFGLHPWWVAKATEAQVREGLKQLENEVGKVAGLGEMGLDRHIAAEGFALQRRAFEAQLGLARRHQKPIVLHCVKAHSECLALLKTGKWTGIVHRFQGTPAEAQSYLDVGLTLSVGGPETVGRKAGLADLWRSIPASRLVLETDAPWDKRFGVALGEQLKALVDIAAEVAKARGETAEGLLAQSKLNLAEIFR